MIMNSERLDNFLKEFAGVSKEWFSKSDFVLGYHHFIQAFFEPENLESADWPDFQKLGSNLHSLNSLAIAKQNAFGKPNYPIEKYRKGFSFLAHGPGEVEQRIRAFMADKNEYASKYLGDSVVSELIGQLFPERYVFMNRRDVEAAEFLGISVSDLPGRDFAERFVAFNKAITPVVERYRRIVGVDPSVPIGLAVDQFFSWLYMNKVLHEEAPEGESGRQIWSFAPGPQAQYWPDCLRDGIAPMGWDELGPLTNFDSKDDVQKRLKELWPEKGEQTNNARANWEFAHAIKPGDLIVAKRGNQRAIGLGVVRGPYRYDASREEYKHIRDVSWIRQGDWPLPEGSQFATKTLTNITKYKEFVEQLLGVIGIRPEEVGAQAGEQHFWLNCAPSQWRVSDWSIGQEQSYTTHNEQGNKRRLYACFQAAKPGDLVIGYETSPVRKVVSLLTVVEGLHQHEGQEKVRFKVTKHFDEPRTLAELQAVPTLADCEPVHGLHQGSLFQITRAEYEAIVTKAPAEAPAAGEPESIYDPYTVEDALDGLFIDEATFKSWLTQWRARKNLILQGPPGVGKTFVARRLASALIGTEDPSRVTMVQFHQSYGYEDFVQGYRPVSSGFELKNGIFYDFCLRARQSPKDQPFVFIIDEINRGNVSRIFGELLMLIEPDKRGEGHSLRLAYQMDGQSFFVPENVYILGMMNTADRSLAVVDYALRRRFSFATLEPALASPAFQEHLAGTCGPELAASITKRVNSLNDEIAKDLTNLGPGFCIGHSFLCRIQTAEDFADVIHYQIAPLVREYWFDKPKHADALIKALTER